MYGTIKDHLHHTLDEIQDAGLFKSERIITTPQEAHIKVGEGREGEIIHCDPECDACMKLVMKGKPAFCVRWPHEKMREMKDIFE